MIINVTTMCQCYDDISHETIDYVVNGNSLVDCIKQILQKDDPNYSEDDWEFTLDLINSGKWYGGEWKKVNDNCIKWTDCETTILYKIVQVVDIP